MADTNVQIVDYYVDGQDLWQDEHAETVPVIGQGVHYGGVFYRVVDVWLNFEKHAPVNYGIAVFLKEVDTPDVFREINPAYYQRTSKTAPPPAPRLISRNPAEPNPLNMGF